MAWKGAVMKDYAYRSSFRKEQGVGVEGFWLLMALLVPTLIYLFTL